MANFINNNIVLALGLILIFEGIEFFAAPLLLLLLLFVIVGAGFNLKVLASIGAVGGVYIVMRFIGKYTGATIGATLSKAPKTVRKYVGIGLIPQAGVALGMAVLGEQYFPGTGQYILTVIIVTTLILEVFSSPITKTPIVFKKAREITLKEVE